MENILYDVVKKICDEKLSQHTVPVAALYSEIVSRVSMPREAIHNGLNELVKSGKVSWNRTLNQLSFTLTNQK